MNDQLTVADILPSVERVTKHLKHLSIDRAAILNYARRLMDAPQVSGPEDDALCFRGGRAECANFCLLCDALNFCFWSDEGWELEYAGQCWTRTHAMIAGVLRAVEADRTWLNADRWANATTKDIQTVFGGTGFIPLPDQRLQVMNETGAVLSERFDGQFIHAVDEADQDAANLTAILARAFASFRDVATHSGGRVVFLKRAQICAADLHRTLVANNLAGLRGLQALTVFADYRLPQLFRHVGALVLGDVLADKVDREQPIPSGCEAEVELRAATVWIADQLVQEMRRLGHLIDAWELDYTLWLNARSPEVSVPHHRTISIFY